MADAFYEEIGSLLVADGISIYIDSSEIEASVVPPIRICPKKQIKFPRFLCFLTFHYYNATILILSQQVEILKTKINIPRLGCMPLLSEQKAN